MAAKRPERRARPPSCFPQPGTAPGQRDLQTCLPPRGSLKTPVALWTMGGGEPLSPRAQLSWSDGRALGHSRPHAVGNGMGPEKHQAPCQPFGASRSPGEPALQGGTWRIHSRPSRLVGDREGPRPADTPQGTQRLIVVDVCGAQRRHHRCPRVPTCGRRAGGPRGGSAPLLRPRPSPRTGVAGR